MPKLQNLKKDTKKIAREFGEVFTPSWICNAQNNLIDNEWFGKKNVFNKEILNSWQTVENNIEFPIGKSWQDYVKLPRMEITCGRAPYLTSRYDAVSGEFIPCQNRIGLLDRKLRIISENVTDEISWINWAKIALENIFGYDVQEENVLLARENILSSVKEYYKDLYKKELPYKTIQNFIRIITQNIWQEDGLVTNSVKDLIEEGIELDAIVGNPPYQQNFGLQGANKSNSRSIYNSFISQAIELNPKYITLITPSRWMTKTSQSIPKDWVDEIINSNKFKEIYDFENSGYCFSTVDIKGGVNYFLWQNDYCGTCQYIFHTARGDIFRRNGYLDSFKTGIVIRNPNNYEIVSKISKKEGNYFKNIENNFSSMVSPKHFFDNSILLTSNWDEFEKKQHDEFNIKYYVNKNIHKTEYGWISEGQIPKNKEIKDLHKVYIPAASGTGTDNKILGQPFYGEPNSVCSQTFLVIGYNQNLQKLDKKQCENIIKYISTRFFRYLVSIKKTTQNGARGVYQFVPLQDFTDKSDINWSQDICDIEKQLYKKYCLSQNEITYINSKIISGIFSKKSLYI